MLAFRPTKHEPGPPSTHAARAASAPSCGIAPLDVAGVREITSADEPPASHEVTIAPLRRSMRSNMRLCPIWDCVIARLRDCAIAAAARLSDCAIAPAARSRPLARPRRARFPRRSAHRGARQRALPCDARYPAIFEWNRGAMTEGESLFGEEHVRRYRETGGKVGHVWREGSTVLLLTTVGRTSGQKRTTPLIYARDGDRFVIVASKGGAPEHPG